MDGKYNSSTQLRKLSSCRLGLISNNGTCVCSDDVKEKKLAGIGCSKHGPYAYHRGGYWVGCTDNKLLSGFCPKGYCDFDSELFSNSFYRKIPRTCQALVSVHLIEQVSYVGSVVKDTQHSITLRTTYVESVRTDDWGF